MHVLAVVLAALFSPWIVQSAATQADVPVTIANIHLNARGDVECDLLSSAPIAATAWGVQVRVAEPDGTLRPHSGMTVDSYIFESYRGMRSDAEIEAQFLRPSVPHHMVIPGKFTTIPILVARVLVLRDRTSFGDPNVVDQIFAKRQLERDTRQRILAELRSVQQSRRGIDALTEAKARLAPPKPDEPDGPIWRGVGHNIELALRPNNKADPDASLAAIIDIVERQYRSAVQHSVRK